MPFTRLMETVLQLIRDIEEEKRILKRVPTYATEAELSNRNAEAARQLDDMERCGLIRMGRTINSRWIEIIGSKQ